MCRQGKRERAAGREDVLTHFAGRRTEARPDEEGVVIPACGGAGRDIRRCRKRSGCAGSLLAPEGAGPRTARLRLGVKLPPATIEPTVRSEGAVQWLGAGRRGSQRRRRHRGAMERRCSGRMRTGVASSGGWESVIPVFVG